MKSGSLAAACLSSVTRSKVRDGSFADVSKCDFEVGLPSECGPQSAGQRQSAVPGLAAVSREVQYRGKCRSSDPLGAKASMDHCAVEATGKPQYQQAEILGMLCFRDIPDGELQ